MYLTRLEQEVTSAALTNKQAITRKRNLERPRSGLASVIEGLDSLLHSVMPKNKAAKLTDDLCLVKPTCVVASDAKKAATPKRENTLQIGVIRDGR